MMIMLPSSSSSSWTKIMMTVGLLGTHHVNAFMTTTPSPTTARSTSSVSLISTQDNHPRLSESDFRLDYIQEVNPVSKVGGSYNGTTTLLDDDGKYYSISSVCSSLAILKYLASSLTKSILLVLSPQLIPLLVVLLAFRSSRMQRRRRQQQQQLQS